MFAVNLSSLPMIEREKKYFNPIFYNHNKSRSQKERLLLLIPFLIMNNEVSEVKLSYKSKVKASERPKVLNSKASFDILLKLYDDDTIEYRETMKMMLLNRAGKVLGVMDISDGGTAGTTADIKVIMQCALLGNANGIILCHNHPSGNLQPSKEDTVLTQKVRSACDIMDMQLLDHIIISSEHYYSFADEGCL